AALLAALCALWLNYAVRLQGGARLLKVGVRTATLGYAIPGMVLAVGLIGPLTAFDRQLAGWLESAFGMHTGLLLTGSMAALVFVYLARFLTVAFNSLESGMARIHPNYDSAARSLGASPGGVLARVHLPLLTPALLTAMLLVFVDVIKELPATLILRPFNFETLATRAYRLASDERLAEASTASLTILAVGLGPTLVLALQNFATRERAAGVRPD
ncbi:MAG: ABC transporter permease subunit, partial [Gammaproteobacteria bacterium]|nr:ABC transporter permease subunit [Gammaproteobacteria bacterium]